MKLIKRASQCHKEYLKIKLTVRSRGHMASGSVASTCSFIYFSVCLVGGLFPQTACKGADATAACTLEGPTRIASF